MREKNLNLRIIKDRGFKTLIVLFSSITILPLLFILFHIIQNGIAVINWQFLTRLPKPMGEVGGGISNALMGTFILVAIACVREPLGFGTLLGYGLPAREVWWHPWTIMVMPPGAFFMLAVVTWICRNISEGNQKKA